MVIGMLPPTFFYHLSCEVFVPAAPDPAGPRDDRRFRVVARLKENVSLDQARTEMEGIAGRLATAFPETYKDWGVTHRADARIVDTRPAPGPAHPAQRRRVRAADLLRERGEPAVGQDGEAPA